MNLIESKGIQVTIEPKIKKKTNARIASQEIEDQVILKHKQRFSLLF